MVMFHFTVPLTVAVATTIALFMYFHRRADAYRAENEATARREAEDRADNEATARRAEATALRAEATARREAEDRADNEATARHAAEDRLRQKLLSFSPDDVVAMTPKHIAEYRTACASVGVAFHLDQHVL